jgi:hypothetical protein
VLTHSRRRRKLVAAMVAAALVVGAAIIATSAYASFAGRSASVSSPAFVQPGQKAGAAPLAGAVVATTAPVVPPPPWSGEVPPTITGPLITDPFSCTYRGVPVICHETAHNYGYFNPLDNCYWLLLSPQPPASDPRWLGLSVTVGKLYYVTCYTTVGLGVGAGATTVKFSPQTPPGYGSLAATQALTITAVLTLKGLLAPTQTTAPQGHASASDTSTPGLVGLPVYLWAAEGLLISLLTKLGPISPSLNIGGLIIQAKLLDQKLEWDMGNGDIVKCPSDGVAFDPAHVVAPACGYKYTKPGTYSVDARSIWFISINIPLVGVINVVIVRTSLPQFITIDELQVVTQ